MDKDSLKSLRDKIDHIDQQLVDLINQRALCAQQVAEVKRKAGETTDSYYRPEREAQILREILKTNPGPVSGEDMVKLFRQVISVCLSMEAPLKVAYLGPEGTYTQAAALKHFGDAVKTVPLSSIQEIFREVEAGAAAYGVVPVENSTEGVVSHTLDMFLTSPLKISGEIELRVQHCLLSRDDSRQAIKEVIAHQQTFGQCREWLNTHLPKVNKVTVNSNAEAARLAGEREGVAAIAGAIAAEIYGLNILASNIEDSPDNTTRFLVIGKQFPGPSGQDKTSLLVSAKNKPGALYALLQPLSDNERTMTRIESRPARSGIWEYVFFLDLVGHVNEQTMIRALRALEQESSLFKILGSYPRAIL